MSDTTGTNPPADLVQRLRDANALLAEGRQAEAAAALASATHRPAALLQRLHRSCTSLNSDVQLPARLTRVRSLLHHAGRPCRARPAQRGSTGAARALRPAPRPGGRGTGGRARRNADCARARQPAFSGGAGVRGTRRSRRRKLSGPHANLLICKEPARKCAARLRVELLNEHANGAWLTVETSACCVWPRTTRRGRALVRLVRGVPAAQPRA